MDARQDKDTPQLPRLSELPGLALWVARPHVMERRFSQFRRDARREWLAAFGRACPVCGKQMRFRWKGSSPPRNAATVDHVEPLAFGGTNTADNMTIMCRVCNGAKAGNPIEAVI